MEMDSRDPSHGRTKSPEEIEVEEEYPSSKVVIPALGGAYLAVFLFALVCYRRQNQRIN